MRCSRITARVTPCAGTSSATRPGSRLIVFGLLSFLARVPLVGVWTASELLVVLAFGFYSALDFPLALAVLGYASILDVAARAAGSWPLGLAAFAAGWVLQGIGHAVYEKNRPAFLRNLVHLLVGPAYLVAEALGIRRATADVSRRSS